MSLEDEVNESKKQIISDGYDMSVGEIMNLYRDNELIISPDYQRLFRWELSQKTRFIESLLLGIPIPLFSFIRMKMAYGSLLMAYNVSLPY